MALEKIAKISGKAVPIPGDDIDTDQIIPARFMKCITFDGLGEYAFYDARFHEDGSEKAHPLNDPAFKEATILVSGSNFGCGSSREHAPQSLHRFGFRGIVAESYAEIFFGNATTLGMPCMSLDRADLDVFAAYLKKNPQAEVVLDVQNLEVRADDQVWKARLAESARDALLEGRWDPIADLLEGVQAVGTVAKRLGYLAT